MPNNNPDYKPKIDKKILLQYIPHGIDEDIFKPLSIDNPGETLNKKDKKENPYTITEFEEMLEFRKTFLNGKDYEFIILFNNRNIRRKMPGDVILSFKTFVDDLPDESKNKVVLILHTSIIDDNGTDLGAVKQAVAPNCNVIFSDKKFDQRHLMYLYNIADVTINIASNEGFGLSSAESLMCGTPVINNVTGGLQDQVGFVDENGNYLDPEKHFNKEWGSNHDGKYRIYGIWAYAVFPSNRSLAGSPPTPYIFDDRCSFEDVAAALRFWYDKGLDGRVKVGRQGRKYLQEVEMTTKRMGLNFIDYIDKSIEDWKPKKRFGLYKIGD